MSFTGGLGRLCNQVIRSLAISPIAKKNDLYVDYYNHSQLKRLGLNLFVGTKIHDNTIDLTETNYWSIFDMNDIHVNLNASQQYFQTNEIVQMIYKNLHSESERPLIIQANPFGERYKTNNDLCVHVRLTDVAKYNPGVNYYLNTIRKIQFHTLYICTDEPDHIFIKQIQTQYPDSKIVCYDEVETIQFASTCKYIILSQGSYSAIIGYLADISSFIYYPEFITCTWCPNIFDIKGWEKQPWE